MVEVSSIFSLRMPRACVPASDVLTNGPPALYDVTNAYENREVYQDSSVYSQIPVTAAPAVAPAASNTSSRREREPERERHRDRDRRERRRH